MLRTRIVAGAMATAAALSSGALITPAGAALVISHHPRVGAHATQAGWSSSNWSGYAVTGSGYTAASGTWVVPSVSATRKATYSSNWVGIDGFNNSSLIQTGTESDWYSGSAHYDAWWEILPAAETVIPSVPVRPGDVMTASVVKGSGTSWTITIRDVTTGKSFSTVQAYNGPGTSAEWVEEAPTVGGRVAPLAHYSSPDTFDPGTVNNGNPHLVAADGGVMVQNGVPVSTPSNPDSDADGFNMAYGRTAPSAPGS